MNSVQKYFALLSTLLVPVLYCVVATAFYLILYRWSSKRFESKLIQQVSISNRQLRREIRYTLISLAIFGLTGYLLYVVQQSGLTQIYFNVRGFGYTYLLLSIPLMIVLHDTYFYWTHRLLHLRWWYEKIHIVHHLSSSPTPFTALSFHPLEAFIQAVFIPLVVLIIPVHPIALTAFVIYMTVKNVLGHCGYDLTGNIFKNSRYSYWRNSSINHNIHHLYSKDNYGLYFTFWDRLMKTLRSKSA
jgi:Delta7-sterol 5-desaturase